MITRRIKNLPFLGVAANSVASLELPLGPTYHEILLKLGGTTFTHALITSIKAKLNGKTFWECSGSRLDSIIDYKSEPTAATWLVISFNEINAKTPGGMYAGSIPTGFGVRSFTLEVTIGAATAPTLDSWSVLSAGMPMIDPETKKAKAICGMFEHPQTYATGGDFNITLPHGPQAGHLVKRVYFFHTNMTELSVIKDGIEIYQELADADAEYMVERYGRTWQSGLYVYDAIMMNDLSSLLDISGAQDLRFKISLSAADTVNVYAEYLGLLSNF